jgi:hypothetical protein
MSMLALLGGPWLACSVVGGLLTYSGALALLLISAFAFSEWSGYGRLVLVIWGTASAACIAVGLILRGCATRIARTLAPTSRAASHPG